MIFTTAEQLRNFISFQIKDNMPQYRESKTDIHPMGNYRIAYEHEVDEFIRTVPYYEDELKEFLLDPPFNAIVYVSEYWFEFFISKIIIWSNSAEWTEFCPEMFEDALADYKQESVPQLCMPLMYINGYLQ